MWKHIFIKVHSFKFLSEKAGWKISNKKINLLNDAFFRLKEIASVG